MCFHQNNESTIHYPVSVLFTLQFATMLLSYMYNGFAHKFLSTYSYIFRLDQRSWTCSYIFRLDRLLLWSRKVAFKALILHVTNQSIQFRRKWHPGQPMIWWLRKVKFFSFLSLSFPSNQRSHVNKRYKVESDMSIACSPFMEGDDMRQILVSLCLCVYGYKCKKDISCNIIS